MYQLRNLGLALLRQYLPLSKHNLCSEKYER